MAVRAAYPTQQAVCADITLTYQMSPKRKALRLIPPHKPAARDEGPRLLPLSDEAAKDEHTSRLDYYLQLANSALGLASNDRPHEAKRMRRRRT
jgi:hypothetical protein